MPQARRNLKSASDALRRLGWFSFWSQLTLSVVSTFILIFSVSFSATVRGDEPQSRLGTACYVGKNLKA